MTEPPLQEESIFLQALDRESAEERAAYLDQVCGDNEKLRAEVEALLRANQKSGDLLDLHESADQTIARPISEEPGTVIGPYKLLQQIGEGGMGVVFMAEQTEPIQRTVALKIIKPNMDTRQIIARFEAERQALAMMDHPNITKVLDAGTTDSGRPYFVMDLVKGVPITGYCDEQHLSVRDRLLLMTQVCQAVQHAHQKGIIHRDLKPSNVLVAEYDGRPVPKIIDFGIAKASAQKLTERTMFTEFGQVIGTVEYMSPEQAKLNQLDIDTRSDIYSLGVLLYELLTGSTPFEAKRLREAAFDEVLRIIREEEPPKPSTKLSSSDTLPSIAANRHSAPTRLSKEIQGELDWIVMKSLEKDRNRRYVTASDFAMDLQHYLDDEPVKACQPSARYRLEKFVRRNKLGIAATSVISLSLVAGLSVSTISLFRERAARERAVAAEREQLHLRSQAEADKRAAQTEAARSKQVAKLMKEMFAGIEPRVALGRDTKLLREILDRTADRLRRDLIGQPEVEADLRATLGNVYASLGEYANAVAMHQEALALRRGLHGEEHPDVAESLNDLAGAIWRQDKLPEAENVYRESLALRRKLFGNQHDQVAQTLHNLAWVLIRQGKYTEAEAVSREDLGLRKKMPHADVASSIYLLAAVLTVQGKLAEAEVLSREALATYRTAFGEEHPDVAGSLASLAAVFLGQGMLAEAETQYRAALAIRRRIDGDDENLGHSLHHLAGVLRQQGKHAEAESVSREELELRRKLLGKDHPEVAFTLEDVSVSLREQGKFSEAEATSREALAIRRKVLGDEHPEVFRSLDNLASVLHAQGHSEEAETMYRQTLAARRKLFGNEHRNVDVSLVNLAGMLHDQGKLAEAEAVWREELELEKRLSGAEHPFVANSLSTLAEILRDEGKLAEAETCGREAIAMRRKLLEKDHPDLASALANLTLTLLAAERFAEAESLARECLAIRQKRLPDDWRTFNAHSLLGGTLLGQKEFAEADPLLRSGYEGMRQREHLIPAAGKRRLREALRRLLQLSEATGRDDEAAEWKKRLKEFDNAASVQKAAANPSK
jgi:serine/threonine protein kinase/Tfp pilus assembly protein PilF